MTGRPRRRPRRATSSTPGRRRATLTPFVIAGGKGSRVWDFDGNEYLDFSSQLVNVNIGHQHPAVVAAIKEQADALATIAPSTRQPDPRRGGEAHRRPGARRLRQGLLHQRRCGCQRERHPDGAPAHRARQGALHLPLVPRQHRCRRSSRPATGAVCPTSTRAGTCTSSARIPYRSEFWATDPGAGVRARAAATSSG